MNLLDRSFWGEQGRVASITEGEYAGRVMFMYPESPDGWWTVFVEPRPDDENAIDIYVCEPDLPVTLTAEWGLEWVPVGSDEELEREHFGWRPLRPGPSWLDADETPGA